VVAGVVVVGTGVTLAFSSAPGDPRAAAGVAGAEAVNAAESAANVVEAGPPALAFALYGDQQAGMAGDTLPVPLVIRVEDGAGRAIAGASVRFAVVTGGGAVHPATALTDEAGTASARWLPRTPGVFTAEARVDGLTEAVRFRATALPRPPARLSSTSATELRGTVGVPSQLAVRVEDDRGNPLAGVEVRFAVRTGTGRVTPAAPVTGDDGIARAEWILGGTGAQEAVATLPEAVGARVVFAATAAPAPLPVRRTVALGGTHSCTLAADGAASCWGGNDSGQLGDGTASRRATPVRVAAPEPLATIAAGVSHSCAVGVSGSAFCWGANTAGQLGDGSRTSRARPTLVGLDDRVTNVAVGMSHSCALDAAGRLFCWGQNTHGQLGDGSRTDRATPVRAGGTRTFRSVALGWAHTCALAADGAAYCWGRNGAGELGDGGTADRAEPARVSGGHRFTAIATGSGHTCGLVADGTIACWGQNSNGQLGNGGTGTSTHPVAAIGAGSFSAVAAGGVHTCGLTRDGAAHCWGRNTYGQLGDGTMEERARATPVAGEFRFSSIFASGAHTCATAGGGALYCWGFNLEGQIGDGTRSNQLRPVRAGPQG
jgi:alpha-tubulin suppressor-like RCC1 family protein